MPEVVQALDEEPGQRERPSAEVGDEETVVRGQRGLQREDAEHRPGADAGPGDPAGRVEDALHREGAGQADAFLGRHSAWGVQDVGFDGGRADGGGRLLTPGHDDTDGFFVARLKAPC